MKVSNSDYAVIIGTALAALAVWGCFGLTEHAIVAVDRFGEAGAGLAQTAARLNGKHGTISMLDEDAGAVKSLIVHGDLVARHEEQSLKIWDTRGTELFNNLDGGITDIRGTIRAATGTANAATAAIGEASKTIQAVRPILGDSDAAVNEIRKLTPDIARGVKSAADTTEHAAGAMGDVHKVADHFEQEIDNPKLRPWYIKLLPHVLQDAVQATLMRWAAR